MADAEERRETALRDFKRKLLLHKENDAKVRTLRESVKELKKDYDKTEDDLKALQSVGQIIGEVLRQLDDERCEPAARRSPSRLPPALTATLDRLEDDACRALIAQILSRPAAGPVTWWDAGTKWTKAN